MIIVLLFFVLHCERFEATSRLVEDTVLTVCMLYFMVVDFRKWRVPPILALLAFTLAMAFGLVNEPPSFTDRLIGSFGGVLFMWSILALTTYLFRATKVLRHNEFSLGNGDLLIVAVIGAFVGYTKLPMVMVLGCSQAVAAFFLGKLMPSFALESPRAESQMTYPLAGFLCLSVLEILI